VKVTKTYVRLLSADVPKTAAFYRRALGLVVRYESPSWTELSADGGIVALHDGGTRESTETPLGFEVDDIAAACNAVAREGGDVVTPAADQYGILVARAADPDGNRFWLAQPSRRP
jgi:lactoylglutathione lyase